MEADSRKSAEGDANTKLNDLFLEAARVMAQNLQIAFMLRNIGFTKEETQKWLTDADNLIIDLVDISKSGQDG